jgi:hypothetical protein
MIVRWIYLVCLFSAAGLACLGTYMGLTPAPDLFVFDVQEPDRDLANVVIGKSLHVFQVRNESDQPSEIIGVEEFCTPKCCLQSKGHERVMVQPGETFAFTCQLDVMHTGEFKAELVLFLKDHGIRPVRLTVHGVGVDSQSAS